MRTVAVAGLETAWCAPRRSRDHGGATAADAHRRRGPLLPSVGAGGRWGAPSSGARWEREPQRRAEMEAVPARMKPPCASGFPRQRETARDRTRVLVPRSRVRSLHGPWPRCRIARAFSAIHWYATRLVSGEGVVTEAPGCRSTMQRSLRRSQSCSSRRAADRRRPGGEVVSRGRHRAYSSSPAHAVSPIALAERAPRLVKGSSGSGRRRRSPALFEDWRASFWASREARRTLRGPGAGGPRRPGARPRGGGARRSKAGAAAATSTSPA